MHTSGSKAVFFFIRRAGGRAGNDVTFSNVTFSSRDKTCGEHVGRPCELVFMLDIHSLHSVATRLRNFVLSALDFGEFKCFDDSIYQNLREPPLFILYMYVNEHDFESPWLSGC